MLTLHYSPQSRAFAALWLIEELGVPHELRVLNLRAPGGVPESYRAIQPHKKVPAIELDGVVVTERAAIAIHLADAFPKAGLAPAIGDPDRGPYLTALVYTDAVIDPCIAARASGWTYDPAGFSFGSFDDMVANLDRMLEARPYAAGDRFTAADTQLGTTIHWAREIFPVLPDRPAFGRYLDRLRTRPAFERALARDAEIAQSLTAPSAASA